MIINDVERKRKRDEWISDHANKAWSVFGGDKGELMDFIEKTFITDADMDDVSIMKEIYNEFVAPKYKSTVEKKDKELEEKDKELEEKDKELEKKDKELEKKDKELEEKDEELDDLKLSTIGHLRKLPQENNEEKWRHLHLTGAGNGTSHKYPKHQSASFKTAEFNVDVDLHHNKFIDNRPSAFLAMRWPVECYNEANVHVVVANSLSDVVKYLNLAAKDLVPSDHPISLTTRAEASIFSNKPDHLVVYNDAADPCLPILCVEVKKPNSDVLGKPKVHGQIFDYLMMAKLQHGKSTFGILTTVMESKVVWLPNKGSDSIASNKRRMTTTNIRESFGSLRPPGIVPTFEMNKETPSPPKKCKKISLPSQRAKSATKPKKSGVKVVRNIKLSNDTYKPHQLFTVLCNAIVASLAVGRVTLEIFDESFETRGTVSKGQSVLVITAKAPKSKEKWYKWIEVDEEIQVRGALIGENECPEFYIVQYLGAGHTSRVWRAVVNLGSGGWVTCVIKFWVYVYDADNNKWLSSGEVTKISAEKTDEEIEKYQAIYKDIRNLVGKRQFGGRWCAILPFFMPLTKNERNRALSEIKDVLLTKFYNESTKVSYQFKESDQCWRHIGKREKKLYIFDLADLNVLKGVSIEAHEQYVADHINNLRRRMGP